MARPIGVATAVPSAVFNLGNVGLVGVPPALAQAIAGLGRFNGKA